MVGPGGWIDRRLDLRVLRHLGADAVSGAVLDLALRGLSIRARRCNPRWCCDGVARVTYTYCWR